MISPPSNSPNKKDTHTQIHKKKLQYIHLPSFLNQTYLFPRPHFASIHQLHLPATVWWWLCGFQKGITKIVGTTLTPHLVIEWTSVGWIQLQNNGRENLRGKLVANFCWNYKLSLRLPNSWHRKISSQICSKIIDCKSYMSPLNPWCPKQDLFVIDFF